jgi:hypothetical protein
MNIHAQGIESHNKKFNDRIGKLKGFLRKRNVDLQAAGTT